MRLHILAIGFGRGTQEAALTEDFAVQWQAWEVSMFKRLADPRSDWKAALRDSRIEWLKNARRIPGALSVLAAINATPAPSNTTRGSSRRAGYTSTFHVVEIRGRCHASKDSDADPDV